MPGTIIEKDNEASSDPNKCTATENNEVSAPPPPQISSPSPPPPPRICAEDLRKGKKRRVSTEGKVSDAKKDKTSGE